MAINMDTLPDSPGEFTIVPPGIYRAKIVKAVMTKPKDPSKNEYLQLSLNIFNEKNKLIGTVTDRIFDTDAQAVRYKLKRLIKDALQLKLTGELELKDLTKVIVGKKLCVEIEEGSYINNRTGKEVKTSEVKMFDTQIYWPLDMYGELVGGKSDAEIFNAADSEEADDDVPFDKGSMEDDGFRDTEDDY